jgi:hypothetical protein
MSHEVLRNIAGEHDSFGRGIILQLLDDVGQSRECVLAPNVDLRVGVVESNLQNTRLGLIDPESTISGKIEGQGGRGEESQDQGVRLEKHCCEMTASV